METGWYNFDTGETDYIEGMPEDLTPYLQDVPGARGLFSLLIDMGSKPHEAFIEVSERLIPEVE